MQFAVVLAGKYEIARRRSADGVTDPRGHVRRRATRGPSSSSPNLANAIIEYYEKFLGPFPSPSSTSSRSTTSASARRRRARCSSPRRPSSAARRREPVLLAGRQREVRPRDRAPVLGHRRQDAEPGGAVAHGVLRRVLRGAVPQDVQERSDVQHAGRTGGRTRSGRTTPRRSRWATASGSRAITTRQAFRTADLLYNKGAYLLLHALHKELGDKTFFTFLKSYQKSFAWKFGYDEERRGPAPVHDQEGLHAVLREVLLGHGDARVIDGWRRRGARP